MPKGVLALNVNGEMTLCNAPPEMRGRGRCNHVAHQEADETAEEFCKRVERMQDIQHLNQILDSPILEETHEVSQEEIDEYARQIDEIAGTHVTADNLRSVLSSLPPDKIAQITSIGFAAAPVFSLPISDDHYEDENVKNKLYFARLQDFGLGKGNAADQMFGIIGDTPEHNGKITFVSGNYRDGLSADEYFLRQYPSRDAMIAKGIGTQKPGYMARKLFYALSDIQVMHDCGGPYIDAMHCKLPNGHVCVHCAHKTQGGQVIKEGQLAGGLVSTALSEALTQLSMEGKHSGSMETVNKRAVADIIMNTMDGFNNSPIIQDMKQASTTEERREILYQGLKKCYSDANIKMDDIFIQLIAKRMTSFKRSPDGLVPVEDGELCDVVTLGSVGNSNNIFRRVQLNTGYKQLVYPIDQEIGTDASNQIMN